MAPEDEFGPHRPVADDEPLARYILELRQRVDRSTTPPSVRQKTFYPKNGETSTFRVTGLAEEAARQLGQTEMGDLQKKPVLCWAQLDARSVRAVSTEFQFDLSLDPARPQVKRHVGIRGWPDTGDVARDDAAMQSLCQQLASKAKVVGLSLT